ncbi:MAG TPA: glycosyltransferase family 2 protein [bacterium]|jgi:GT2 family glycosyltransferase
MNPNAPSVAIIVVNWNRREDALACLESLAKIAYPNSRIILVDNGSTDGSVQAVRERFAKVQVIALPDNRRFAGGNNAGLRDVLQKGDDFALLLNNDTTVEPDFLNHLIAAVQEDSRIGLVAPKILYSARPEVIWFAGGVIKPAWGYVRHIGLRQTDDGRFDQPCDVSYLTGCCLLIRRDALQKVGLLDEGFYLYSEDADYCLRVTHVGYRLLYEPKSRIYHKVSSSTGGAYNLRKWKQRYISLFRLVRKHTPLFTWPLFFLNLIWELLSLPINAFLQTSRLPDSK